MRLQENVSVVQLFALVFNFEIGTSIVVGLGTEAKQDAWIAVLIGTVLGVGVTFFYYKLLTFCPGKNLFEIMEFSFGRIIAVGLSLLYIGFFFYISARISRDFGELMATAILPNTPIEVISMLLMLLIAYVLYLGLEPLARTAEIFSPYIIIFIGLLNLFLWVSGKLKMFRIEPVLANGWKPIAEVVFPDIMAFPFGLMVTFTTIMCYTTKFRYAGKVAMLGVGAAGLLLSYVIAMQFMALGVDSLARSNFPLLNTAREVSVAQFIERIDAIVVFIMMLGIFVQCSVYMFAGFKGIEYVFNVPYRSIVFPISMLVSLFSVMIANNFAEHIEEGLKYNLLFFITPMAYAIPPFLFAATYIKYRKQRKKKEGLV